MWYQIDAVDRVAKVCPDWDLTAKRNGAPDLKTSTVIGRSIWSFLAGDAAKLHYAQLFETVRQTGIATQLRIRGDGPTRQSLLQLDITPSQDQTLEIKVKTLRDRAVGHAPLWDITVPRSSEIVVSCSWCKAIDIGNQWTSASEALPSHQGLYSMRTPSVAHHICPSCDVTLTRQRLAAFAPLDPGQTQHLG